MTFTNDEVSATTNDEANMSSSDQKLALTRDETEDLVTQLPEPLANGKKVEDDDGGERSSSSNESRRNNHCERQRKARSVSFAPTVEQYEIPSRYDPSYVSPCQPTDYLDALVESYKLQTLTTLYPFHHQEEKRYIPKTARTRLNTNWREHRIRHLMNKLEELSLWDREEELKISQAEFLREQKLEQIQDRQRNHDLCLQLMRQRHESEMESAILLDRAISNINDENTAVNIARAMHSDNFTYDSPTKSSALKQRFRQGQNEIPIYKTPIGRYRQFETNMANKLEIINRTCQSDGDKKRTYASCRASSVPVTVVPLFSETYATLLSVHGKYPSNRDKHRCQYGTSSHFNSSLSSSSEHAASPDYERLVRAHSNRDVRVPFKEDIEQNNDENDNDNPRRSRLAANSSKRSTNSLREYSFIHSPQPTATSVHQRNLNDDLNAITQFPVYFRNTTESSNSSPTKHRSSSMSRDNDYDGYVNYHNASGSFHQTKMMPLLSAR